MPIGVRMAMFVLVGLLFAAPAQAAQLFPLQTGDWMEQDKQDNLGTKWIVRVDVLEEVTLDGKKYFHVREQNYDGPGTGENHNYLRSTDTELFIYRGPGVEEPGFKLGPVGTWWIYEGGATRKEIVAIEPITIPCGGTYTAYKYKQYPLDPNDSGYQFEWVVPGLGWIAKEEDHWGVNTVAVLARMKTNPLRRGGQAVNLLLLD
jgi:hypothetical protein